MIYKFSPCNTDFWAQNLRYSEDNHQLTWQNARGQGVLIVKTPYGQSVIEQIKNICALLNDLTDFPTDYTNVDSDIWVKFVTPEDKARNNNGSALHGSSGTYTIFAYQQDADVVYVFEQSVNSRLPISCSVKMRVQVQVVREMTKQTGWKGFFCKKKIDSGFYSINFYSVLNSSYVDGDLQYKVEGFSIPITKKMIEKKKIYIMSAHKPDVQANTDGLELIFL